MDQTIAVEKNREQEIMDDIESFVSTSIRAMSSVDLEKFEKNSTKIMKDSKRRLRECAESHETAESFQPAHPASTRG